MIAKNRSHFRLILGHLFCALLCVLLWACAGAAAAQNTPLQLGQVDLSQAPFHLDAEAIAWVEDTLASMTGALVGARHGVDAWPAAWVEALEEEYYVAILGLRPT